LIQIITNTFVPYEFENRRDALDYIRERCQYIKKSLRFIKIESEQLIVRCPLSGDYLVIVSDEMDIRWLDNELRRGRWYRES
jgi:hypothetical protein